MKTREVPQFPSILARKKLSLDESWQLDYFKFIESDSYLLGMRKTRLLTRGKRKGERVWKDAKGRYLSEERQTVVTKREIERAEESFEKKTGCCHRCGGDGQDLVGVSVERGRYYGTCKRCSGTGKPPTQP